MAASAARPVLRDAITLSFDSKQSVSAGPQIIFQVGPIELGSSFKETREEHFCARL